MMIDRFSYDGKTLKADPPIHILYVGDVINKKYYRAEIPAINVIVVEKTEHVAILSLSRGLVGKWTDYALADDDELDVDSLELKRELLKRFKDVTPYQLKNSG